MPQSFNCPSCGASLEYAGSEHTIHCGYCNNSVPVPEELWKAVEAEQAQVELQKTTKNWVKYLLIFLVITVGLPTCLSLVIAVIVTIASILGVSIPFIIPLLRH
jgi:hypothetical protein